MPSPYPPPRKSMQSLPQAHQTHHRPQAIRERSTQKSKSKAPSLISLLPVRRMQSTQRTLHTKSHDCRSLSFRAFRANRRRQRPKRYAFYACFMQEMPRHQNRGHASIWRNATAAPITLQSTPIKHCKRLQKTRLNTPTKWVGDRGIGYVAERRCLTLFLLRGVQKIWQKGLKINVFSNL